MSYMLPHLHNGWQVDQAILSEEDRVVVIRFGHDWDPTCMKMDEVLYSIAEKVTYMQCSPCWVLQGGLDSRFKPEACAPCVPMTHRETELTYSYGEGLCQKWLEFLKI